MSWEWRRLSIPTFFAITQQSKRYPVSPRHARKQESLVHGLSSSASTVLIICADDWDDLSTALAAVTVIELAAEIERQLPRIRWPLSLRHFARAHVYMGHKPGS